MLCGNSQLLVNKNSQADRFSRCIILLFPIPTFALSRRRCLILLFSIPLLFSQLPAESLRSSPYMAFCPVHPIWRSPSQIHTPEMLLLQTKEPDLQTDILMDSLLEPAISATCLLSSDAEVLLQKVLFDAIIIVDYPFSHCESEMHTCSNHLKGLALSWLFVAENALSFMREHFNKSQAYAYAGAFFKSVSHSWLMGWLINKLKIEDIVIQQISSSPAALFDWISGLQNQASDADISKLLEKVVRCRSRWNSKLPVLQPGGQNKECGKDLYTNDYSVAEMNFRIDRGRKRKGVSDGEMGLQLKTLKYQFHDDSFNRPSPLHSGNGWGRKNEMGSLAHDDDMEITVQ